MKSSTKKIGAVGLLLFRKAAPQHRLAIALVKRSRQAGRIYIAYRVTKRVLQKDSPITHTVTGEHVVIDVS